MIASHILVVDDEEILCELLRRSLQRAGYTVYSANSGAAALELFLSHSIDLVISDVRMPGMDGFALCSELRKRSKVPIIMVTSLSHPGDVAYAFSLGVDDCVTKPFQFGDIMTRIQALLQRSP